MEPFLVYAAEPQLDGTLHLFNRDYAAQMRLPFDKGWDHWEVHQGSTKVFEHTSFEEVRKTADILNHTTVLRAA